MDYGADKYSLRLSSSFIYISLVREYEMDGVFLTVRVGKSQALSLLHEVQFACGPAQVGNRSVDMEALCVNWRSNVKVGDTR